MLNVEPCIVSIHVDIELHGSSNRNLEGDAKLRMHHNCQSSTVIPIIITLALGDDNAYITGADILSK